MPAAVTTSAADRGSATIENVTSWTPLNFFIALIMPTTVPNRPTNGAVAPIVASIHCRVRSSWTTRWRSRWTAVPTCSGLARPTLA